MAALAVRVGVALAAARGGLGAAASAHSLIAALHGSGLLAGRVVKVCLDCRLRPSKPPGDLGDREPLLVAVVARERRSPAPFTYTITCGHAGDDSGRSRRLPNELDSRRWYSETMLGSVVTSKAEHRRFPRIRKSRRVPIRDLALPAVVLCTSELAVPDSLACICNAKGSATGCPVITTVSVAQAKQLWHVDELADDRKWSVPEGSSRPAHTSAPAGSLAAILQAVGGSAGAQLAICASHVDSGSGPAFVFTRVWQLRA